MQQYSSYPHTQHRQVVEQLGIQDSVYQYCLGIQDTVCQYCLGIQEYCFGIEDSVCEYCSNTLDSEQNSADQCLEPQWRRLSSSLVFLSSMHIAIFGVGGVSGGHPVPNTNTSERQSGGTEVVYSRLTSSQYE